jgi:hypothetical protein
MAITHTEYHIAIDSKKVSRAVTRKHSRQFNQRIEDSIQAAILKAARRKLSDLIKAGKLAKEFKVRLMM